MTTKFLQTEEDMKDIHGTVFLRLGVPYLIDNEGMIEAEGGTKIPLNFVGVNFRVVHRPIN